MSRARAVDVLKASGITKQVEHDGTETLVEDLSDDDLGRAVARATMRTVRALQKSGETLLIVDDRDAGLYADVDPTSIVAVRTELDYDLSALGDRPWLSVSPALG